MTIWIDIINTPQVSFFVPFINEFRQNNHEVLITCRDSGNTLELLKQHNLSFHILGDKADKGPIKKSMAFANRLFHLYNFIRKSKPDIAVSQSSFYQPVIAGLIRIPCLYTNDNEHAKGNLFGFLFADKVMLPVALKDEKFTKKLPLKKKLSFYPGVKEAVYLSQDRGLKEQVVRGRDKVFFRPEPWTAQYYKGPLNFFDDTLLKLAREYKVVVLPRDNKQVDHYNQEKFRDLTIAKKPLRLHDIISECLLFIGAGGSMTRELAVMEVPVISVYQSDLLCVDRYLAEIGLMQIDPDLSYESIKSFISSKSSETKTDKQWMALKEGEKSYSMIKDYILNLK